MAHSQQFLLNSVADRLETRARLRDAIESIRATVLDTRRTMAEGREAIAKADKALARRLSEPKG